MTPNHFETMLSFSSEACVVLDRSLTVVAGNDLARTEFDLGTAQSISKDLCLTPQSARRIERCFGGTAPSRFAIQTTNGKVINASGWRLGGAFKSSDLIAVKLQVSLRIKAEFASMTATHRYNLQRARRLLAQKTLLEAENELLAVKLETDPMTGLLNAQGVRALMQQAVAADTPFALFYIDLNGLKIINDTLGHAAGDGAIMALAQTITESTRQCDAAARLGGDEFALVVMNVTSPEVLHNMGDTIARSLAKHRIALPDGQFLYLTAAIGAACWPQDGTSIRQVEKAADAAMYISKRSGQRVNIAGETANSAAQHRNIVNLRTRNGG